MAKLIFLAVAIFALVLWFRHKGRSQRDLDAKRTDAVEDMVRCQVCGVNLPRSEAIFSQGRLYCCEEHRRRDLG